MNLTASAYCALGATTSNSSSRSAAPTIRACFAAAEPSRDFDWIRVRGSALYRSGDNDPYDGKATGFDAIFENPQFAGADTSYWIRQAMPLSAAAAWRCPGATACSACARRRTRASRTSTIPGSMLLGVGADFDLTPRAAR